MQEDSPSQQMVARYSLAEPRPIVVGALAMEENCAASAMREKRSPPRDICIIVLPLNVKT